MWLYIQLAVSPEPIMGALYYRRPQASSCLANGPAQKTYNRVAQLLFYNCPHLVMILALPVVYFARRRRRLLRMSRISANLTKKVTVSADHHLAANSTRLRNRGDNESVSQGRGQLSNHVVAHLSSPVVSISVARSHGYILLVLLTVSVTICWTPIDALYTLKSEIADFKAPQSYYQLAVVLFSFQTTVDPIIFTLAVKSLRDIFRHSFSRLF